MPLFVAGFAHAQDAANSNIEEVVVTGRAGVEEIRKVEVSYAVTTIGGESLRMDAPIGVADALGSVPGFWVESTGGEASAMPTRRICRSCLSTMCLARTCAGRRSSA